MPNNNIDSQPLISIIVPVYNVEQYLRSCIDSICQQDYQNWECILIDDGSKDSSGLICDELSADDDRINVIHKENGGVSSARNIGLKRAKGQWICFVDSDDRLVNDALSHMLGVNIKHNADVCLCPIVSSIKTDSEAHILDSEEKLNLIWSSLAYRTEEYVRKGYLIDAPHAKLFRTNIIKSNKLIFIEGLSKSEDALFDAQFYHHAKKVVMDSHQVYHYTLNPTSICHTYKFDNIPMFATLLEHEETFVTKYYSESIKFKDILYIRALVALEQVLYEAGAEKLSLKKRTEAVKLFMSSNIVERLIKETEYQKIASYFPGRSRKIDLKLIQNRRYRGLIKWIDLCRFIFEMRVIATSNLKKVLRIDSETSISSFLKRKRDNEKI